MTRWQLAVVLALPGLLQQAPPVTLEVRARALQPGEFVLLTINAPEAAASVHTRAFDRDWPAFRVSAGTWRAFLGVDLDVAPGDHIVTVRVDEPSGVRRATRTLTVRPKRFPTRRLSVDDAFVNPPADAQKRIEAEAAELDRLWRSSTGPPRFEGTFLRPVPHDANSAFGTRSVFNDQPRSPHSGADFASPAGTPVSAPAAGRVVLARDLYFSGLTVIIDHGAGLVSLFAHLASLDDTLKLDASIASGDRIGRVGATGRVTGPHLHWATRVGGARVDPLSVMSALGGSPKQGPSPLRRDTR
jgi:murein DD-endopeptidase MepM/ murein hydrolase activator NlpD